MKQMRGLLIAAILLAVLSGLVYWSNKHKAEEAAKPSADAPPTILTLDSKQIQEIRIQKAGSDPVVLSKLGDRWDITQPTPMPADQDAANGMVSTAAALMSERLIDDKPANLAPFGLADPPVQVSFKLKSGKTDTIDIGRDTPTAGAAYVKLAGDPKVYSVSTSTKTSLDKSLNDLRDKRLLTFNRDRLARVELTNSKGQTIEFGKDAQGDWQILKPQPMRADGLLVDDLVRKLSDAKLQFDAGKISPQTFAAATKLATAAMTDNSGTQTAEFRQDKDKITYARSSVADGIYKIDTDVASTVGKSVDDFRNKKLFDFGFTELSQVTAQGNTYTKSGEKWFLNGKEMDGSTVLNLVDKLRDLSATGFAPKASGDPVFTASITTADKKRNEKVTILRDGTNNFAQREGEPAVYVISASVVDDLIKAAGDIKPATPPKSSSKK
jgi:hypothetical protein